MNVEQILKALGPGFLSLTKHGFAYGPAGNLLLRNVERNWFQHCVTMPRYNVFLTGSSDIDNTLNYLKESKANSLPLGLAVIENFDSDWDNRVFEESYPLSHKTMSVKLFSEKTSAKDLFHRKQRERKVWWRKFARYPSRFSLTECKRKKNGATLEIKAQFPFGDITVESITHWDDALSLLQEENRSKLRNAGVVEHCASLDWGVLTFLCDAYKTTGKSGELFIHPKLSPYKATFHTADSDSEDQSQLAVYLNNQLRAGGLDTVMSCNNHSAKSFHIPFVVKVDGDSLKNGTVSVNSKQTTLSEKVHITNLVEHIAARCS